MKEDVDLVQDWFGTQTPKADACGINTARAAKRSDMVNKRQGNVNCSVIVQTLVVEHNCGIEMIWTSASKFNVSPDYSFCSRLAFTLTDNHNEGSRVERLLIMMRKTNYPISAFCVGKQQIQWLSGGLHHTSQRSRIDTVFNIREQAKGISNANIDILYLFVCTSPNHGNHPSHQILHISPQKSQRVASTAQYAGWGNKNIVLPTHRTERSETIVVALVPIDDAVAVAVAVAVTVSAEVSTL
jgi:hypothetical protein